MQKMLCCWKQHAEEKAAFLWHLTCRPPAQKDQIPRSNMGSNTQGCDLRVCLETKWMQGCAMDTLQCWAMQRGKCISSSELWDKVRLLSTSFFESNAHCEWMGSTVARARRPLPSHALTPSKCLPSKACPDYCFITWVMMALYLKT